jgi:hypothetical protein
MTKESAFDSEQRQKMILFILFTIVLWPLSLIPNQYQVLSSQGVESPRLEVDHSPPFNDEVKNAWNYTSMPLYASMAFIFSLIHSFT